MSESVPCRGCGRRLTLPPTIVRAKARCPKCRTKVEDPAAAPDPQAPDAYQVFLSESQAIPRQEVLSLDDALPPDPRPQPPPVHFPPPFRFTVRVLADSLRQFHGPLHGVLTPHGLFLEAEPNRPLLFVPVGAHCEATGNTLALNPPGRRLEFQLAGIGEAEQLAADTAAFLAGQRPVPLPAEYRPPRWLVGVGTLFALGLATGPVLLAAVSEALSLAPAIALSVAFAVLAMLANAGIALFSKLPTGAKIGAMAILNAALFGLFLAGAMAFLREDEAATTTPEPPPPPVPGEGPPEPPFPPPPNEPPPPVTHYDFVYRDGNAKFEDGPADVASLTVLPGDTVLVAYADGSTRLWQLEQPTFEPSRLGLRAPSAIRRIAFDSTGKLALLTCDTGLAFVALNQSNRPSLVIPGEFGAAYFEPNRDRFAAVRNDRVQVRYVPMDLLKNPPAARVKGGFVTAAAQDETLPLNVPPLGFSLPGGKPTFLAWHPRWRLIAGRADGTIASIPLGGAADVPFVSAEHRAAVRAWEQTPNGDFAFGDADGFVGYWPARTTKITKFRTGRVAIRALAFNFCGGELAVADEAGKLSFWYPDSGWKHFEVNGKRVSALAYGPRDDVLLLASGRGVEAWWLPELARLAAEK